ncbi:uncharacterized protein LOC115631443 [Scaptodrosophila lebanonensis]|uniref:Uncharacterized protein LOC115631443 n=1 Tax=Drosophila lebanonensis TaxID=7225 RepID=A0A6J2U662_DROLE|nr:uncharacterized protein LOC115631443 [Scaptodrosophila lebanonensis]
MPKISKTVSKQKLFKQSRLGLSSSKGSRTGNSANNKELKVLTLLQTVP